MANTLAAALPPPDATRFFKALADDTRLAIVRLLALTDLKVGEMSARLGAPQNAVSYHLKQLRSVGLLRDRHSSSDARDVYYSVDLEQLARLYAAAGGALHPALAPERDAPAPGPDAPPLRVLFLCTHNSARSQLAEGLLRRFGGERVAAFSAGSEPAGVHPLAIRLLEEWGVDASGQTSKPLAAVAAQQFDDVITVCDRVRESCPEFPGQPRQSHWSLPDPLAVSDPQEQALAFQSLRAELAVRIRALLQAPHPRTGRRLPIPKSDLTALHTTP